MPQPRAATAAPLAVAALVLACFASATAGEINPGDCVFDLSVTGDAFIGIDAAVGYTETYENDAGKSKTAKFGKIPLRSPAGNDERGAVDGHIPVVLPAGTTCSFTQDDATPGSGGYAALQTALEGATVGATGHDYFSINVDSFSSHYTKGNPDSDKGNYLDLDFGLDGLQFQLEMTRIGSPLDPGVVTKYSVTPTLVAGMFSASGSYRKSGYDGSIDVTVDFSDPTVPVTIKKASACALLVSTGAGSDVTLTCSKFYIQLNKVLSNDADLGISTYALITITMDGDLVLKSALSDATQVDDGMLAAAPKREPTNVAKLARSKRGARGL